VKTCTRTHNASRNTFLRLVLDVARVPRNKWARRRAGGTEGGRGGRKRWEGGGEDCCSCCSNRASSKRRHPRCSKCHESACQGTYHQESALFSPCCQSFVGCAGSIRSHHWPCQHNQQQPFVSCPRLCIIARHCATVTTAAIGGPADAHSCAKRPTPQHTRSSAPYTISTHCRRGGHPLPPDAPPRPDTCSNRVSGKPNSRAQSRRCFPRVPYAGSS